MMEGLKVRASAAIASGAARHYGGFVLAGLCALATDTAMLTLLTRWLGLSPFVARPFGIACAMIVSWLINRTMTFRADAPPSIAEFSRFAGVSLTSQIVNYSVFAALLLASPAMMPELALLLACFVSMFVSYAGFRFGVFGKSGMERGGPEEHGPKERGNG
jgi:putative flippase GtrA